MTSLSMQESPSLTNTGKRIKASQNFSSLTKQRYLAKYSLNQTKKNREIPRDNFFKKIYVWGF